MDISSKIKIFSLNCAGLTNKLPILHEICKVHDIILLQETWITPNNINFLSKVHPCFESHSISAVNFETHMVGRPHGGLGCLWRKDLAIKFEIKSYKDPRLMGIALETSNRKLFILNVYLPYFSNDNYDEYLYYVGLISSIIEDYDHNDIMIVGDFNASVGGLFYNEWKSLCDETDMQFIDVERLDPGSYTHVNNGSFSCTWLDHCLVTSTVSSSIEHIHIEYDDFLSDHFPLCIEVNFNHLPVYRTNELIVPKVKWNFSNDQKAEHFYDLIVQKLRFLSVSMSCRGNPCNSEDHKFHLEEIWDKFIDVALLCGRRTFGVTTQSSYVIPGWNEFVKTHYETSREALIEWRNVGSPRHGWIADNMRRCRARFKAALRQCRSMEDKARALAIANKYKDKNMQGFWRDIKSLSDNKASLPTRVDEARSCEDICNVWKAKFSEVLNTVNDEESSTELQQRLQTMDDTAAHQVTPAELVTLIDDLSASKTPGTDNIPSELYKLAPPSLIMWLCSFFNAVFSHEHVPGSITRVMLIPLLKSSLKDPCCSANYRPIAIATTASKILEKIIFNRIEKCLTTTPHQFGFKKKHSTDSCIYALKEVINYYKCLGTPLFLCFVDIKSAFDKISYKKLFCILCDRGVPKYLIVLLSGWYQLQKLFVCWGNTKSEVFGMQNGIRQGSCLSPYLFNVYVDSLNIKLIETRLGCHVAGMCTNNFSYADDLVLLCPDARSLNSLLKVCDKFANENYITFSTAKTEAMLILPRNMKLEDPPKIYLSGSKINYVESFRYLGHVISNDFYDDLDIARETRNLYVRGNTIIRKFSSLDINVKIALFKSYCYPLYTCSLWSRYRVASLNKLKVCYNNVMRQLMGVPRWHSARTLFVQNRVKSFFEILRTITHSLMVRIKNSDNPIIHGLLHSDAYIISSQWERWRVLMFVNQPTMLYFS